MERERIEAAQHGDREAYVDLIRPRLDRLFGLAQRILRDGDRADDAVQDALVLAWRDMRGLRDPDRLDAWLHRLVVNSCMNHLRRERHHVTSISVLPLDGPTGPDGFGTVADRDQLDRGFLRLPADQRAILTLHHFLGYPPREIAEILGIPPGTARSRLHHAHRAMRAALDADARVVLEGGRPA